MTHIPVQARLPERAVLAVDLVRGHPRDRRFVGQDTRHHAYCEFRLGHEPARVGHRGSRSALTVGGPGLGQVELPVDQRPPGCGGVGGEHPDLAVIDLPRGSGVLPGDAGRGVALLDEPGLVEDQHPVVLAEVLEDVSAHVVAHPAGFPLGTAEQVLEPVGRAVTGLLGELPGVLTLHRTQQTTYVITRASTRLHTTEPARNTSEQVVKPSRPLVDLDRYAIHEHHSIKQSSKTQSTTVVLAR